MRFTVLWTITFVVKFPLGTIPFMDPGYGQVSNNTFGQGTTLGRHPFRGATLRFVFNASLAKVSMYLECTSQAAVRETFLTLS